MSLMEGRPDIFQELREKFVDTFKVSFLSGKKMCFLSVSKMHEKEITDFLKEKNGYAAWHEQCFTLFSI